MKEGDFFDDRGVDGRIIVNLISKTRNRTQWRCLFFSLALQPPWALASVFQFHDHFTDGGTPWTSDWPVSRPLPKHGTTQTQNKHIHTPNIHALCGIRTHDPSFRTSEDGTRLRPLGYRDRQWRTLTNAIYSVGAALKKNRVN
jgi:hypothetical protein